MSQQTFLLAYSSVDGQTRAIMQAIAEELHEAGYQVRFCDIERNAEPEWEGIDQVVVGGAVRYGDHRPGLYDFVKAQVVELTARPNAFFSVNMTARKAGKDTPEGSRYMQKFLEKSPWHPQRLAVFAGALKWDRYGLFDKTMIRFIMWLTKGPTDTRQNVDLTDWAAVRAFAKALIGARRTA
ncbi:menaquinone-dependent protoporphyrinogen IX dehydrogenase [Gallaecimonas kandeliae]|uniref:menaquinone-dependent protoporphyrinogen IX dehydrogenase n=1 Tax=Gallaecimonas kandeliae TaxID=3029055 RepID=UPI002649A9AC|nr:menaquinone-dependent protoporphyrinogen IX dehydrogenase [Gallaecimonas kandeliae]WKE65691.1 menaquinone-dependent protoporphyrinogen IX dehydrogenase [Gallaecimonas kandeliae]